MTLSPSIVFLSKSPTFFCENVERCTKRVQKCKKKWMKVYKCVQRKNTKVYESVQSGGTKVYIGLPTEMITKRNDDDDD